MRSKQREGAARGRYWCGCWSDRSRTCWKYQAAGGERCLLRSLTDPIDTSSPQGKFTLQTLGAVAGFERALIRKWTKAGLEAMR